MNILLIGNGFDLAHHLPTYYSDFLSMTSLICQVGINWLDGKAKVDSSYSPSTLSIEEKEKLVLFCNCVGNYEIVLDFQGIAKESIWLEYFRERSDSIGDKWLDFEEEIRFFAEEIKNKMGDNSKTKVTNLPYTALKNYALRNNFRWRDKTFYELFQVLQKDLNDVKRAIAIYMNMFIDRLPVETINYFFSLEIDKLLSFNYTSVFTENYLPQVDTCYIHGDTPDKETYSKNVVLGFETFYLDGKRTIKELIPFEKYYQRIVNRTDNKYFWWLREIENKKTDNNLYIFGHSLSAADGDVLKLFLTNKYIETTIYCKDDADRAEKIQNLSIVLGPKDLIELSGGVNPKIKFVIF